MYDWNNMMGGWGMGSGYMTLFLVLLLIIAVVAVVSLFRR